MPLLYLARPLQGFADLAEVDTVQYLSPFLEVIMSEKTSGPITGVALSSDNKFILYNIISRDSLRVREAMNNIAIDISRCRFEATDRDDDEVVLMKVSSAARQTCTREHCTRALTDGTPAASCAARCSCSSSRRTCYALRWDR